MRKFQINGMLLPFTLLLLTSISEQSRTQILPARLDSVESYLIRSMEKLSLPGVAVAVVQGDSVLFIKGF